MASFGANFKDLPVSCNITFKVNRVAPNKPNVYFYFYGNQFNGNIVFPELCDYDMSRNVFLHIYFTSMPNFNGHVTLSNAVKNCYGMFDGCYNYNQPITIPDSVINCAMMFYNCDMLNQPVHIGNNVKNCYNMFTNSYRFNQPITIPGKVTDCTGMFEYCNSFNQSVQMGTNVKNCHVMFYSSKNFNHSVTIPDGVTNCRAMFAGCGNFNQHVTIADSVEDCSKMFDGCNSYNQGIHIPASAKNCAMMFAGCESLAYSAPVIIPYGVTDTFKMFNDCWNVTSPMTLPDSIENTAFMFCESGVGYCGIPSGVKNCVGMYAQSHRVPKPNDPGWWHSEKWYDDVYVPDSAGTNFSGIVQSNFCGTISVPQSSGGTIRSLGEYAGIHDSGKAKNEEDVDYLGATIICRSTGEMDKIIDYWRFGNYYAKWEGAGSISPYAGRVDYNEPTTISEGTETMANYFRYCPKYDQPTVIPNSVKSCSWTFAQCYSFDSPVTFEE